MLKKGLLTLLFVGTLFGADAQKLYKADIDSKQANELQKQGYMLIDVRTIPEFKFSHPKDSKNIPIYHDRNGERILNENFVDQVDYAVGGNTDKPIILICRSGSRTIEAANLLAKNGFSNVYNIKQGFVYDWLKTNLPIEK